MQNKIYRALCGAGVGVVLLLASCAGGNKEQTKDAQPNTSVEEAKKEEPQEVVLTGAIKDGMNVYNQYCITCHQKNGTGVPNLNPPLKNTEYVLGEKQRLITIVLKGSNEGLKINGKTYANAMPPHNFLNDKDIANVLSYVRNSFGNQADTVSENEVAAARKALK